VQTVFGLLGGISAHPDDVMHMKRTADRLFGDQYHWSVLGAGSKQMAVAAMAAAIGGNVRVGLEDSLWIGPWRTGQEQRPTSNPSAKNYRGAELASRHCQSSSRDTGPERCRPSRLLKARSLPEQ